MSTDKDTKDNSTEKMGGLTADTTTYVKLVIGAFILALSAYGIWFGVMQGFSLSKDPAYWAQFGDYLGGTIGPIVGLATIVLLVITLNLQRTELREQREHLAQSAKELAEQNQILMKQSFEQSFFTWLGQYQKTLDQISFSGGTTIHSPEPTLVPHGKVLTSTHALKRMAQVLGTQGCNLCINDALRSTPNPHTEPHRTNLKNIFISSWLAIYHSDLGSLRVGLRTLYGLVRWIDQHELLSEKDKKHYISIIKARLTEAEALILYANGLTEDGAKFGELLSKYSMLTALDPQQYEILRYLPLNEPQAL
ncbi:hypothetical protein PuT2_07385 [Pusillimonas sp. T2]|uniref:putative phage abortive infection protein n=1 Tax=Pusillimonas sp. T2 TaxID=1548123 RepID=UPI000B9D30BF|nr:putative phage abortive infection protein [Pusillimonas sp. T2]OXR49602.1 hypothetical protein PuT2_07385 [Pusillimonas sp. T2]